MSNKTFDLQQAITEWRRQLARSGVNSCDVLDELESHLRDDLQQQMHSGVGPRQAFDAALQRLGQNDALKIEFKKANPTAEVLGKLMSVVCIVLAGFIVWMSGYTFLQMELSPSDQIVAYAAVAVTLLVACGWRYAVPFLPVIASRPKRMTVGLGCIVSGIIFCNLFLHFVVPHFESQDRQLPAIGFWAVFPIALFACLGLALMMSAEDREHWKMGPGHRSSYV
jgi:hypothetical protein